MFEDVVSFVKSIYKSDQVPLHAPHFVGNEKKYVLEAIDSTFVSSVGEFVNKAEDEFAKYLGANRSVLTSNGTSALHAALHLVGVKPGDEVITQALTFIATANAISYCGAKPIFLDSCPNRLGLSLSALRSFLEKNITIVNGIPTNKQTGAKISACVPMHVFGHPVEIDRIVELCRHFNIHVVEDAAESFGSTYKGKHLGLFGDIGVSSFNGNKIITSGGGGLLFSNNVDLMKRAKHVTTTAKVPHPWEFAHDEIGFNYRMPNLNAALLMGQLEQMPKYLTSKRRIASAYREFFSANSEVKFVDEPSDAKSNFWLNSILFSDLQTRDAFLEYSNKSGVMTRPIWKLMTDLPMYQFCQKDELVVARDLYNRLVNIPSSVVLP